MYKVKVEAIRGLQVYAKGRWLTCIGNQKISINDYVWTDGRCVYGNFLESSAPFIPTIIKLEEAIPILCSNNLMLYYDKVRHNIGTYDSQKTLNGLINNRGKFEVFTESFLDAELSSNNDLYILKKLKTENGICAADTFYKISDITSGGDICCNDKTIDNYKERLSDIVQNDSFKIFNGFIDEKGNYTLLVHTRAVEYSHEGEEGSQKTFLLTKDDEQIIESANYTATYNYWIDHHIEDDGHTWDEEVFDSISLSSNVYEINKNVKFPMQDNWYCIITIPDELFNQKTTGIYPHESDDDFFTESRFIMPSIFYQDGSLIQINNKGEQYSYGFDFYDSRNNKRLSIISKNFWYLKMNVLPLRNSDFLVADLFRAYIFDSKGEEKDYIAINFENYKFRYLKDIKKWKKRSNKSKTIKSISY